MVKVLFAGKNDSVIIPTKEKENAGYDVYANFDAPFVWFKPHQTRLIPTGLYSAFDSAYYFKISERGSNGSLGVGQRAGIIDSGYRGEWFVALTNHNDKPLMILKKEYKEILPFIFDENINNECIIYPYEKAICQALLTEVLDSDIVNIPLDELKLIPSKRGDGKLGSSGK